MDLLKFVSSGIIALGFLGSTFGQSVRNIRSVTDGNEVRISYRIEDSTPSQIFFVMLSCKPEGGDSFEPSSLRGDIGHGIPGGKSDYTIIWKMDQDPELLGKIIFEIQAVLERDLDQVTTPVPVNTGQTYRVVEPGVLEEESGSGGSVPLHFERRMFVAYNGSLSSPYGMSIGTIRNWGFYTSFRFGGTSNDWERDVWFTAMGGATKYILGKDYLRLHGYAGFGISVEAYEEYIYNTEAKDSFFSMETGLTGVIGFLNLTLGVDYILSKGAGMVFGIGFIF
ncbi:MAG: hypothetical protein ACWGNV_06945 [Bacteroidales bacterium]